MAGEAQPKQSGESRPVPDPTALTTDAVNAAVTRAQEYTDLKLETIVQRLSDMDRATAVLDETVHRTPTEIEREVAHLRELIEAKIAGLTDEIERGDDALGDHIKMQVEQLRAALTSTQREVRIIFDASQEAIAKAEALNKERWEGNNKWRDQSADRERSQQEEMAKLSGSFIRKDTAEAQFERLRESADAQFGELRRAISELTEKVNKLV
jgi:chromosome segregation ATPase